MGRERKGGGRPGKLLSWFREADASAERLLEKQRERRKEGGEPRHRSPAKVAKCQRERRGRASHFSSCSPPAKSGAK